MKLTIVSIQFNITCCKNITEFDKKIFIFYFEKTNSLHLAQIVSEQILTTLKILTIMSTIKRNQLFVEARVALIFTSMTFAFRASLEGVWSHDFNLTKEQLGWIFSPAFW